MKLKNDVETASKLAGKLNRGITIENVDKITTKNKSSAMTTRIIKHLITI